MTPPTPQAELRPAVTPADTAADPFVVPLLRLRGHDREPVPPEVCLLGPRCLVCRWRREGLLDPSSDGPQTNEIARAEPGPTVGESEARRPLRPLPVPEKAPVRIHPPRSPRPHADSK